MDYNLSETRQKALHLASTLKPGDIIFLQGEMGAGKTSFVGFIGEYFDFNQVSSPSFSLINEYKTSIPIYHIDLYRCLSEKDIDLLDLDYYLTQKTHIVLIEWFQKASWLQSHCTKLIHINVLPNQNRKVTIKNVR